MSDLPKGFKQVGSRVFDERGNWVEMFDGKWKVVLDGNRTGWWRFYRHYDRDGYCDNPSRGY